MYGKGKTNIFGEEITFCVKYDKFGTWKWKCTAIHIKSNTVIKVNLCETQKIAVQYALKSLIEKLTKTGKLKSKAFTKGIMAGLKNKGWTMQKIMQTIQQQMQQNRNKKKQKSKL